MTIILVRESVKAVRALKQMVRECYPDSIISTFSSSDEALEAIRQTGSQIDLCFAEVEMRGSSGFRLIEELHRRNRRAKAVLIARDQEYALECWRAGVNDYLIEPLTMESVRHAQISCSE